MAPKDRVRPEELTYSRQGDTTILRPQANPVDILDVPLEAMFYAVKGIKAKRAGKTLEAEQLADQVEKELNKATTSSEAVPHGSTPEGEVPTPTSEIDFGRAPRGLRKSTNVYEPAPEVTTADGKVAPYKAPFDWGSNQSDYLLAQYGKLADDPKAMDAVAQQRLWTNMRYVKDENDAKSLFNELGKISYQAFLKSKGDRITHAEVLDWAGKQADELADVTGTDVRELVLRMNADKADIDGLAERLAGYRAAVSVYSRRAADLANAYKRGDLSEFGGDMTAWRSAFLQTTQTLFAIAPQTEGIKSGLGRNLALLQAAIGPDGKPTGALAGMSPEAALASKAASPKAQVGGKVDATAPAQAEVAGASAGDQAALDRLVEKLARADNPKAAKKIVEDAFSVGAMDVNNELWVNALLSGPKTHVVNMMTSTLKSALVMPAEQMLAGVISRDMDMFMMGADQYAGYFMAIKDSLRQTRKALTQSEPVLDPSSQGFGGTLNGGAIQANTFGLNTETPLGALVSGFGQLVRLPSRLLTTEDELLKQLNYRARMYAMATREAREMRRAHGASDAELGKFVSEYMERGFDENGAAINPEALAWARDATFTNDLSVQTWGGGRSIGESLNAFAANHPGFRMVMPFSLPVRPWGVVGDTYRCPYISRISPAHCPWQGP